MSLAVMSFDRRPKGADMARLFKTAVANFGAPRYLIFDLGGEFTSRVFLKAVAKTTTVPRTASVENLYANAQIESFWKTLKGMAYFKIVPPLTFGDFEQRAAIALHYYIHFRPHSGLDGRTPIEVFRNAPVVTTPVAPPRGLLGGRVDPSPLDITFVDGERKEIPTLTRNSD